MGFDISNVKPILELGSLILGIVNGIILAYIFVRDRAKLSASFIHPEIYNWFFELPSRKYEKKKTNVFGFFAYLAIVNKGLRAVSLTSWELEIELNNGKREKLHPISIPQPQIKLGDGSQKLFPVLGVGEDGLYVKSGDNVNGFAYYELETFGETYLPKIINGKIKVKLICEDAFGKKSETTGLMIRKKVEDAEKMVPNISKLTRI